MKRQALWDRITHLPLHLANSITKAFPGQAKLAVLGEALSSGFSLVLNTWLVITTTSHQYGQLSLVFAIAIFATGIFGTLVRMPLSVMLPALQGNDAKIFSRAVYDLAAYLCLALSVMSGVVFYICLDASPALLICAAIYVAMSLLKEYAKSLAYSEMRISAAVVVDVTSIVISGVAAAIALLGIWRSVPLLMLALSLGPGVSAIVHMVRSDFVFLPRPPAAGIKTHKEIWGHSRWALLGVLTTEAQSRGYLYIVTMFAGPAVVGQIQAGRLIFSPMGPLVASWGNVSRVRLSKFYAVGDLNAARQIIAHGTLWFTASSIGLLLLAIATWPHVERLLYHGRYPEMLMVAIMWGTATAIAALRSVLSINAQAKKQFRMLARATCLTAPVSLVIAAVICFLGYPSLSVAATVAAELILILLILPVGFCKKGAS